MSWRSGLAFRMSISRRSRPGRSAQSGFPPSKRSAGRWTANQGIFWSISRIQQNKPDQQKKDSFCERYSCLTFSLQEEYLLFTSEMWCMCSCLVVSERFKQIISRLDMLAPKLIFSLVV